jgi:DNA-binding GntR family transcriptional regulator
MDLWSEIGDLVWLPLEGADVTTAARDHDLLIDAIEARAPERAREIAERHVATETGRQLELRLSLHQL